LELGLRRRRGYRQLILRDFEPELTPILLARAARGGMAMNVRRRPDFAAPRFSE
jgi:hypothetical protein